MISKLACEAGAYIIANKGVRLNLRRNAGPKILVLGPYTNMS